MISSEYIQEWQKSIDKLEANGFEMFWHSPCEDEKILELESLLKCRLPSSFKSFLTAFGGGGEIGSEISGVEDNEPKLLHGGTVYGDTVAAKDDFSLPDGLIVIFYHDHEVCWCLDLREKSELEEIAIVSYNLYSKKVDAIISKSFKDFFDEYLEMRLNAL